MTKDEYLERLLKQYKSTFDICRPYPIGEADYLAYGYFYNHNEKYVLTREAKLWEADTFEHLLVTDGAGTVAAVEQGIALLENYIEPELVRKGNKYPEANHMYSYMTVVILTEETPKPQAVTKLKKYKYIKNYQFTLKGYSEGRLIMVDLKNQQVWTNKAAKPLQKVYAKVF